MPTCRATERKSWPRISSSYGTAPWGGLGRLRPLTCHAGAIGGATWPPSLQRGKSCHDAVRAVFRTGIRSTVLYFLSLLAHVTHVSMQQQQVKANT